ncbi:MAG: 5'-methylthioadenosine/S-adenosylhomocysteine nucleosidase [Oscillospiraceae bacterium]|nr:5'-methylthioadenosine/S-adenosylhomocysteine nucleosidase [Oscillospiraceae bacterium]MBQ8624532.1 5'-methylthioadenosine/S-adenosylhomocysteine nucleosidase [Oscillospiraceae bacterium]
MNIGMIVAVAQEIGALLEKMGKPISVENLAGYEIKAYEVNGHSLYVTQSGAGEISAASSTQLLISKYGCEMIVNFGVCGGLTDEMSVTRTAVVEKVVHYDFDTSEIDNCEVGRYLEYPDIYIPAEKSLVDKACEVEPTLMRVICASADKFVGDPDKKRELNEKFGAHICEMESAGILLTANRNGVPALLIKAVSDSVSGGADEFANMISEAALVCISTLLKIIERV